MKTTSLFPIFAVISLMFSLAAPSLSKTGTFTVHLPRLGFPPDEEGQGWSRPQVWGDYSNVARDDSITVPDGRPIYALIVSGYAQNSHFDELLVYRFAKHLMEHGAYVHYAWWNNLLAPYMERPLHHDQSNPGNLLQDISAFTTAEEAANKALPGEDYQFVADAKLFLSAIHRHNPDAIIIVLGHSMGGGAVVHLASQTTVRIDILAPIDPVGNRNYPWAGGRLLADDFNWTRWRVTRDKFLGYKRLDNTGTIIPNCDPAGRWLEHYFEAKFSSNVLCTPSAPYIDPASTLIFGNNVVHLYHRYQKEALFPFDFGEDYDFGHTPPPDGSTDQAFMPMKASGLDLGGWSGEPAFLFSCCPLSGAGVGWLFDGHGEIVGHRGPLPTPVPMGVRVRTSLNCGTQCPNLIWPWRYESGGEWVDPFSSVRQAHLLDLENLPVGSEWVHRPTNPDLCLVSSGLITLFDRVEETRIISHPIANPGFEWGTSPWVFYTNGSGMFMNDGIDDGNSEAGHVYVETPGSNVQLYQAGLQLEPYSRYRLRFQAYSNSGHNIGVLLHKHGNPYISYGLESGFDLGTSWDQYEVEFETDGFNQQVSDGRLRFWLAPFAEAGDHYYFDDVDLEFIGPAGPADLAKNNQARPERTEFSLNSNYPNPFNPTTTFTFDLPYSSYTLLAVYNVLGQQVASVVNETLPAGTYSRTFDAGALSSGVYFYRLTAGEYSETRRMLLQK